MWGLLTPKTYLLLIWNPNLFGCRIFDLKTVPLIEIYIANKLDTWLYKNCVLTRGMPNRCSTNSFKRCLYHRCLKKVESLDVYMRTFNFTRVGKTHAVNFQMPISTMTETYKNTMETEESFKWNPFFTFTWSTPMTESIPLTLPSDLLDVFEYYFEPTLNRVQMVGHILSEKFYRHTILLYTSPGHIGSYFISRGLFLIISYNCKCLIFLLVHCMQRWVLLC